MTSAACEVVPWFRFSPVFVCAVIICMFCVLATPTLVAPGAGLSPGRTLRGFAGLSAASGGTCRALPYIEPDGMVSAEDYRISDPFNQTEHCTYEFRDVCLRPATATESGANVAGGGEELAFVIETGGGCDMTGWRYPCGELRTGPGLGKNFEVVRGDLTGAEFDPVPTLLFDRRASGGDGEHP